MSSTEMALAQNDGDDNPNRSSEAPRADEDYELLAEKVRDLVKRFKLGDVDEKIIDKSTGKSVWKFEAELNEVERLIGGHKELPLPPQVPTDAPSWFYDFLDVRTQAREYYDSTTASYSFDLYQAALKLYRQLPKRVEPAIAGQDSEERRKLKSIVQVIIGGLEYLHSTNEFGSAIAYAQDLYEYVNKKGLVTETDQAHAEKAIICYFLGRTLRDRGIEDDFRQATEYFYQCSDYFFAEARRPGNSNEDVIYARTRAAVSLAFGAGFLYFNAQSELAQAKGLIAQARHAFLKDSGEIRCKHHYGYLELLYATILRAEAGELPALESDDGERPSAEWVAAKDKLDSALDILEGCRERLKSKPKYYIPLLYNKALVHLFRGPEDYPAARECVAELLERSQASARWQAHALVIRSRLERREGKVDAALADALRAFNQSDSHLPVRVEALFARGEAHLDRNNLVSASADFEKAYQLSKGANKKQEVMSLLLLAEVAIAQQRPQLALERFAQANGLIKSISHGFILNRFRRLEAQLTSYQDDFVIRGNVEDLEYEKHESALRCWLLRRALCEDKSLANAAQRLKVSKKTIYQWRDTYKIKL
jgi:hypothetical protein